MLRFARQLTLRQRLVALVAVAIVPAVVALAYFIAAFHEQREGEVRDQAGSDDVTYHEMKGAPHYLEGHRREAMALVADWMKRRYP